MADAKKMSNKERAIKGAMERWHPSVPRATHSGVLLIAGQEIACDVLEDGKRVLRRNEFLRAIGKSKPRQELLDRAEHEKIPVFLMANNLRPFFKQDFSEGAKEIYYKSSTGKKVRGFNANILVETCEIYLKAREAGVLTRDQDHIAHSCEIMMRSLAKVGLVALIDECTGFQLVREKTELQKILSQYISEELRKWTSKFPDEFFKQVYRIHGWEYLATKHGRPQCIGNFINKYIYEKLPEGVLNSLKEKNPLSENGHRRFRHHQFLTEDIGDDNLKKQLVQTITVMKLSNNLNDFKELVEKL